MPKNHAFYKQIKKINDIKHGSVELSKGLVEEEEEEEKKKKDRRGSQSEKCFNYQGSSGGCGRSDFGMLVVRVAPSGQLADSRPCKECTQLMLQNGIKSAYFSTSSGNVERQRIGLTALETNSHVSVGRRKHK